MKAVETHILSNIDHGADVVFAGEDLLERENTQLIAKGFKPLQILSLEEDGY